MLVNMSCWRGGGRVALDLSYRVLPIATTKVSSHKHHYPKEAADKSFSTSTCLYAKKNLPAAKKQQGGKGSRRREGG